MLKKFFIALAAIILALVFASLAYLFWASNGAPANELAIVALEGDAEVRVTTEPWISFTPSQGDVSVGVIFYPGGQADPQSYAPLMRQLAEQGYLAVIVAMPFNLAVFDISAADKVLAAHPGVKHWLLAGHSLGGVMAAQYAFDSPGKIDGLALWAAYPAGSADLTGSDIPITVIYGSADKAATVEEIDAARYLLPTQTRYSLIDGGDHYQFGYFDEVEINASISREQQQKTLLLEMLALIERVQSRG